MEKLAILQANLFYYEPAVSVPHEVIVKNRYSQILMKTTALTMHPLPHFLIYTCISCDQTMLHSRQLKFVNSLGETSSNV